MNKIYLQVLTSLLCCFLAITAEAQVYVKADAAGTGDGSSWANAFTDLQAAINASGGVPIWVAAGTWHPAPPGGNQTATFAIDSNVPLYGGFSGTESSLSERDIAANPTVLSGDLGDDDVLDDFGTNRQDNVQTVMTIGTDINNVTIIDGFTFTGGHADGTGTVTADARGGAIYCEGMPIFRNCTFTQNFAQSRGGALNAYLSSGNVTDSMHIDLCMFSNNLSNSFGGGFHFESVAPDYIVTLTNSSFTENKGASGGGAVIITRDDNSHAIVDNCQFIANDGRQSGGLHMEPEGNECTYTVSNCIFDGNKATVNPMPFFNTGGGLWCFFDGAATNSTGVVENCQFTNNVSASLGGGMAASFQSSNNSLEVRDCHFENNSSTEVTTGWGGGALSIETFFTPSNAVMRIRNTTFKDNASAGVGGGVDVNYAGDLEVDIQASTFTGNDANGLGLAINSIRQGAASSVGILKVDNCLFTEHNNQNNAVISIRGSSNAKIFSNTIADNTAVGIIEQSTGLMEIQNTILDNQSNVIISGTAGTVSLGGNLVTDDSMDDILTSSDVQTDDPLFVGSGGFPFQLSQNSPAIDAGVMPDEVPEFDIAGNLRVQGQGIDIGVYESPFTTDVQEVSFNDPALSIFPNPSGAMTTLALDNEWHGSLQVQIMNALGQEVWSRRLFKDPGIAHWKLDVQLLKSGVYSVFVSNGERAVGRQLVKQ